MAEGKLQGSTFQTTLLVDVDVKASSLQISWRYLLTAMRQEFDWTWPPTLFVVQLGPVQLIPPHRTAHSWLGSNVRAQKARRAKKVEAEGGRDCSTIHLWFKTLVEININSTI